MNRIFYYLILTSYLSAEDNTLTKFQIIVTLILCILSIILVIAGYKFIKLRTKNYDIDYFTKLFGWAMAIFGIIGIFECLKYLIKGPK